MWFPARNIFCLPFVKGCRGSLVVSSPLSPTQTRRVVRDTRIPAGLSAAQLQSPAACCHIPCTPVGGTGPEAPRDLQDCYHHSTVPHWCIIWAGCQIRHNFESFRGRMHGHSPILTSALLTRLSPPPRLPYFSPPFSSAGC